MVKRPMQRSTLNWRLWRSLISTIMKVHTKIGKEGAIKTTVINTHHSSRGEGKRTLFAGSRFSFPLMRSSILWSTFFHTVWAITLSDMTTMTLRYRYILIEASDNGRRLGQGPANLWEEQTSIQVYYQHLTILGEVMCPTKPTMMLERSVTVNSDCVLSYWWCWINRCFWSRYVRSLTLSYRSCQNIHTKLRFNEKIDYCTAVLQVLSQF